MNRILPQRHMRRPAFVVVVTTLVVAGVVAVDGCATGVGRPAPPPSPAESLVATTQLNALLRDHWAYVSREFPSTGAWAGLRPERLPDHSAPRLRAHRNFARAALNALEDVFIDALSPEEFATYQAMEWDMDMLGREAVYFETDLTDLAPSESPLRETLDLLANHPLDGAGDAERYQYLVHAVVPLLDTLRAGLERRRERGVVLAAPLIPRAAAFVRSLVAAPAQSRFMPGPARRAALDSATAANLVTEVGEAIIERLNPALEAFAAWLEGPYAVGAPERLGLGQYPGGIEHYRMLVRRWSTLDLDPEEAHAIGLSEAARMAILAREALRAAGQPSDRDSVRAWLRTSPAFAAAAPESVIARLSRGFDAARARPPIPIGQQPASPVSIDTVPATDTAFAPLTEYVPASVRAPVAVYRINPARLRKGAIAGLTALVHRDLMPGRHVQASLQGENQSLPAFRRAARYPGFADGWALYALELADSLASAPADAVARVEARLLMLRAACGLVIDTGINYFGWTRDEALEFLREYLPDDDAVLERDFIIPAAEVPGSLVAGALGAREFHGFRRWVQTELGARFDLATFHEIVLQRGALPLPVLGSYLEWWIWSVTSVPADTSAAR